MYADSLKRIRMLVILSDYDGGYHSEAVINAGSYKCSYVMDFNLIGFLCDLAAEYKIAEFCNKLEGLLKLYDVPERDRIRVICCQDGCIIEVNIFKKDNWYMIKNHGTIMTGEIYDQNRD